MLDRLRPRILELTARSREPITVFINSGGGLTGNALLRLLKRTTQDDARCSSVITVAAPKAASGAANLLSAGDFAIASPQSTLLYHGARWPMLSELTVEWGRTAQALLTLHELAAAALARSCVRRFLSIVSAHRPLFAQRRADGGEIIPAELDCFLDVLRGKLSPAALTVLDRALPLFNSYNGLLHHFEKRLRRGRIVTETRLRRLMLQASMAFEYESGESDSSFDGGMSRISDHFYFLNSYFDVKELRDWIAGRSEPQTDGVDAIYFLPFRTFFLALCRALQEGENSITPLDAVWLGLVDTVRDNVEMGC